MILNTHSVIVIYPLSGFCAGQQERTREFTRSASVTALWRINHFLLSMRQQASIKNENTIQVYKDKVLFCYSVIRMKS